MRSTFTIATEDPKLSHKESLSGTSGKPQTTKRMESSPTTSSANTPKHGQPLAPRPRRRGTLAAIRIFLLDVPLLVVLGLYAASHLWVYFNDKYLDPQLRLFRWRNKEKRHENEMTYYGRVCTEEDLTARSPEEIMITPEMTTNDAVDSMLKHGISIFPDLLQEDTAKLLRESIIEYNKKDENFFVIGQNTKDGEQVRYSYGIRVEQDEVVRQAIHEIATHPVLRPVLEEMMGPWPSIYKFHAITSVYGAKDQNFHHDVVPFKSAAMYSRSFVPLYTLFIPLQNTTAKMGSTDICPGTHVCARGLGFCRKSAFRASGEADNWPTGHGALMNQQTTHRGREHLDSAPDSDRVLFTLAFAPRPRHTKYISDLETRGLSLGGSYATHWTQWGHTVNDLADNWKYMWNPIKTMRAFGWYKTSDALWGWDWISVLMTRMANEAYSLQEELIASLESGDLSVIPEFIRPPIEEDLEETAWYYFVLDLAVNIKKFLLDASYVMAGIYVCFVFLLNIALYLMGKREREELKIARNLVRVIAIPGIVYLCYYSTTQHIENRPWARHIRTRKLYQLSHDFRGPMLPSVLPHKKDVLLLDDFQSEYLASYTRLHEVGHPGNKAFKQMIVDSATGYGSSLSESMKMQLCSSLLQWNRQLQSRFLTKNNLNQWAELTRPMAMEYAHKQLLRQDNAFVETAVRRIDYLLSETKFGTWRDTSMHRTHIPSLLRSLELRIIRMPQSSASKEASNDARGLVSPRVLASGRLPVQSPSRGSRSAFPPAHQVKEPFRGAWLKVGDKVEGRYENDNNEWYRGEIVGAKAHMMEWQVKYYNDEMGEDLCRECVRKFVPYKVGEDVEFKLDPASKDWLSARILEVHDNGAAYDFQCVDDSKKYENSSTPHIRRFKTTAQYQLDPPFRMGQQVDSRWYEKGATDHDGKWYHAMIVNRYDNATYDVEYFVDGDFTWRNVKSSDLRSL